MNMSSVEGKKKLLNSDQVIQQSFGGKKINIIICSFKIN